MDIIELVFNDLNEQQKKDIILDFNNIDQFLDLIINDELYLLELFIRCIFTSEEDISQFEKRMLKYTAYKIAEHFFEHEAAFDKMEHFLRWASKSEEEIGEFRKSLAYIKPKVILKSFISNNKLDFAKLEYHFQWCAL